MTANLKSTKTGHKMTEENMGGKFAKNTMLAKEMSHSAHAQEMTRKQPTNRKTSR